MVGLRGLALLASSLPLCSCADGKEKPVVVMQSGNAKGQKVYRRYIETVEQWASAAGLEYVFREVNESDSPLARWAEEGATADLREKQRRCLMTMSKASLLRRFAADRAFDGWLVYMDMDVAVNRRGDFAGTKRRKGDPLPTLTTEAFAELLRRVEPCEFVAQDSSCSTPNAGLLLFKMTRGRNALLAEWHRALVHTLNMPWSKVRRHCAGCSDQRVLAETLIHFQADRADAAYDGVCARNGEWRRGGGDLAGQFSECYARHFSRVAKRSCGDQEFLPESRICLLNNSTRLNIHDHPKKLKKKVDRDPFVHTKVKKNIRRPTASWSTNEEAAR